MNKKATIGYDLYPTTTENGKVVYSKKAELILNSKYYPKGELNEFPVNPETGEKLEIDPDLVKESKVKLSKYEKYSLTLLLIVMVGFCTSCYYISKRHEVKKQKRVIVIPETYLDEHI
jgi:hypothetical protein